MSNSFQRLKNAIRKLPGMGAKSAERLASHLALENKAAAAELAEALEYAQIHTTPCPECFGLSEDGELCAICANQSRAKNAICIVEHATDIDSIEKSGAWRGLYHVLGGKLSPLKKVGPEKLNMAELFARIEKGGVDEVILALSNDIEGEATCHYIQERLAPRANIKLMRIGFGLPSGSQLAFADPNTIKSAMDSRKNF